MFLNDFLSNSNRIKIFNVSQVIIEVISSVFNVYLFSISHLYVQIAFNGVALNKLMFQFLNN